MLTNNLLKLLIDSNTYNEWHKKSGLDNIEASSLWIRYKFNPDESAKKEINKFNEENIKTETEREVC